MRAEPEIEESKVMDETSLDDQLLKAWINDKVISRDQTVEIPAVSGMIDEIAKTIANIPIKLYRREGNRVIEEKEDYRVRLLNEETGDTLDAKQMKQAIVRDYYLGCGGFVYVEWRGLRVESLRYVFSEYVSFAKNSDVIFKDYWILVQGKKYDPEEFIRVLRNSTDGIRGNSIVEQNNIMLSVAYNSLRYEETLVKTGGNKKGFVKSAKRLTQQAIDKLKEAWSKLYQNNTENVVVLNDGLEFQEASNTSVEMQMNENKKTNGEEFRRLLGVPEDLGTEQGDKAFIKYCINAFMGEFMTALNRALLLESEKGSYYFAPDMYELTKGDEDKRYSAYKMAAETGWLQIDEIRAKENMEPLGINMVKLGLQDVLYDPKNQKIYIPNMNKTIKIKEGGVDEGQGFS